MNLRKIMEKTAATICITSAIGLAILVNQNYLSERIKDEDHLKRVIEEEKNKLGLEKFEIHPITTDYQTRNGKNKILISPAGVSKGFGNGTRNSNGEIIYPDYIIGIEKGAYLTRGIIKHELAHIANGDCEDGLGWRNLKSQFFEELTSNVYGGTGLNLGDKEITLK